MHQDTDSDVAEQRDGGKVKVKWTQEEVIAMTWPSCVHVVSKQLTLSKEVIVSMDSMHKTLLFLYVYRMTSSKRWLTNWEPVIGNT